MHNKLKKTTQRKSKDPTKAPHVLSTLMQIKHITINLIDSSLSVSENFPIVLPGEQGTAYIKIPSKIEGLNRKMSYQDKYDTLVENKSYNIKLIDGALLGMLYTFTDGQISKHTLFYFPSPHLEEFQNNQDIYVNDELYSDIFDKERVIIPIRFDYDPSSASAVTHPHSHLTIGQYKHCRIPVSSPLSPYQFIVFIIRNFYNIEMLKTINTMLPLKFEKTLFEEEELLTHINIGN